MSVSADRMFLQLQDGTMLSMRAVAGVIQVSSNGTDWTDLTAGGGTVTTDTTLTGDGSALDPLGIDTTNVPIMADVIATAGGDVQDLTLSGLNGDTDGDYEIIGDIIYKGGVGAATFTLRPFGTDETSLGSLIEYNNGSAAYVGSNSGTPNANWFISAENAGADTHIIFRAYVASKTGRIRQFWSTATSIRISASIICMKTMGWSTDTATNMSALTIHSTVAASFRSGSFLKVRKLKSIL